MEHHDPTSANRSLNPLARKPVALFVAGSLLTLCGFAGGGYADSLDRGDVAYCEERYGSTPQRQESCQIATEHSSVRGAAAVTTVAGMAIAAAAGLSALSNFKRRRPEAEEHQKTN